MKKVVLNGCYGGFGLSEKAYKFLGLEWDGYGYDYMCDRENPKLVECVETLGDEASGSCARLYVEEYDDEKYDYMISNYDGIENLELVPIVHRGRLETSSVDELVSYLTSLGIQVVD